VPCERYLTQAENGLAIEWSGFVWMNPPFSKPLPWIERFVAHSNGIALVPTSNGKWMDILWDKADCWLMLKRINFWTPYGPAPGSIPNRCWLVGSGERGAEAVRRCGLGKTR